MQTNLSRSPASRARGRSIASLAFALAAGVAAAAVGASAFAAIIQFDEPVEGSTRACVESVCATSTTATVGGSVAGTASQAQIVDRVPPHFQPLINLFDLQTYQTNQTIGIDLVGTNGSVLNTLTVNFSAGHLVYSADFTFSSDAGGPLANGPLPDVLVTGGYQSVSSALQAQLDFSALPFPFDTIADFFKESFFPVSVAVRSGPLGSPNAQAPSPSTAWLLGVGLLAWHMQPPRRRRIKSR